MIFKSPHGFGRRKECGERENTVSSSTISPSAEDSGCRNAQKVSGFSGSKEKKLQDGRTCRGGGGHSKVVGLDSVSQEQVLLSIAKRLKKKREKNI